VSNFLRACAGSDEAFQPHRPNALRHQTGPNARTTRLTACSRLEHRFARTRACTRAFVEPRPRGLSPRALGSTRSEPLFRAHRRPCQRDDDLLRASSPSYRLPCSAPWSTKQDAYDRLLLPTASTYEYPCLACYRHLFEACASPLTGEPALATRRPVDLAFHDARSASAGFVGLALGLFLRRSRSNRTSDTPVAPVSLAPRFHTTRSIPGRQGRFLRPPVKMGRIVRPGVPSIARGHSRARVNRCRSRVRSRDAFRHDPALGAFSPAAPCAPLSRRLRLRCARPPSPPIATFRAFTRNADARFCESDCRPTTSATTSNARTHPRASDSRLIRQAAFAVTSNSPSLPSPFLGSNDLPLSKKDHESYEPRQPFRHRPDDAASAPPKYDIESHRPVRTSLAGDASTRSSLAAMTVGR